jgi:hypothetical protein
LRPAQSLLPAVAAAAGWLSDSGRDLLGLLGPPEQQAAALMNAALPMVQPLLRKLRLVAKLW